MSVKAKKALNCLLHFLHQFPLFIVQYLFSSYLILKLTL